MDVVVVDVDVHVADVAVAHAIWYHIRTILPQGMVRYCTVRHSFVGYEPAT